MTKNRIFLFIWVGCLFGSWSVLPYISFLNVIPSSVSTTKLLLLTTLQAAILYAIILWLTSLILPKTDLKPFSIAKPLKQTVFLAVVAGGLVGVVLVALDRSIFQSSALSSLHPPFWAGMLASLYGGLNEEVLLRLFLFSLIYFLSVKICRNSNKKRLYLLWSSNIIVAILFGLGHLPVAFKLVTPSVFETFRILLLNGFPGLVFGWLYWSRGFLAAVAAHFVADLIIHAFLI